MDYVTTKEAALMLNSSPDYIGYLCRAGTLTAEKFGRDWRIERRSVERYQAARAAGQVRRGPKKGAKDEVD